MSGLARSTSPEAMLAILQAQPGRADELRGLIEILASQVRAEEGCIALLPLRDREDPDRFYIHEQYRDETAFQTHLDTDYVKAFRAGAAEAAVDAQIDSALRRLDELTTDDPARSTP